MGFYDVANHPLIYTLVICGIIYVLGFTAISFRKFWKRAMQKGYTKDQLMNVIKSSATFSIVPSVAIIIGFFSLAAMLGIPWPWWRLSVVGAVGYEIMASSMALGAMGVDLASATGADFIVVMWVMTIGILGGLISSLFISKRIQKGSLNMGSKDMRWGALGNSVFMMTIMVVFMVPMVIGFGVELFTLITSALITFLLATLIKKTGAVWLNNFVLAIALLGAMASSVLWAALLG